MMTVRQVAYRKFLQSDFWKELSARVKRGKRCEKCKSRRNLQSHHKVYPEDWYQTKESDLQVLCRRCHAAEHGLIASTSNQKLRPSLNRMMVHRDDWLFSLLLHRLECLTRKVQLGGFMRERDWRFLDKAMSLYPSEPGDTCMALKVGLVRNAVKVMEENKENMADWVDLQRKKKERRKLMGEPIYL